MIEAFKLAGTLAAHAIWSMSEGETLTPMLGYTTEGGQQKMDRLVSETLEASVTIGKKKLDSNDMDANDAALLYDGRISLGNEKVDAIIIEIRVYFSPGSEAVVAVPYTPKSRGKFRVHKPKLVEWRECEDFDKVAAFQSFFEGIEGHKKGAKIWNESLDESR